MTADFQRLKTILLRIDGGPGIFYQRLLTVWFRWWDQLGRLEFWVEVSTYGERYVSKRNSGVSNWERNFLFWFSHKCQSTPWIFYSVIFRPFTKLWWSPDQVETHGVSLVLQEWGMQLLKIIGISLVARNYFIGIRIYGEVVLLLRRGQLFDKLMCVATQEHTCADHKR